MSAPMRSGGRASECPGESMSSSSSLISGTDCDSLALGVQSDNEMVRTHRAVDLLEVQHPRRVEGMVHRLQTDGLDPRAVRALDRVRRGEEGDGLRAFHA